MKATADIQFIPIGHGVSVRKEIRRVIEMINARDFVVNSHASGTNLEGELDDILSVVGEIHKALHKQGTVRLLSNLKLETRADKVPTLAGKVL